MSDLKNAKGRANLIAQAVHDGALATLPVVERATGKRCLMLGIRHEVGKEGQAGFTPLAVLLDEVSPLQNYVPDGGLEVQRGRTLIFATVPEKEP